MKQLVVALVATFALGSAFAQQSPEALVRNKGGEVQVQASGNVQVGGKAIAQDSSAAANAGDVVTVVEGSAKVTYANGCTVTVTADAPHTIGSKPPVCQAVEKSGSVSTTAYVAGAAVVAAAAAAGGGGGDGDDKPSSP